VSLGWVLSDNFRVGQFPASPNFEKKGRLDKSVEALPLPIEFATLACGQDVAPISVVVIAVDTEVCTSQHRFADFFTVEMGPNSSRRCQAGRFSNPSNVPPEFLQGTCMPPLSFYKGATVLVFCKENRER